MNKPLHSLVAVALFIFSSVGVAQDTAALEQKIIQAAEEIHPKVVAARRDFHMHPELSNREERTARVVAEKLRALNLDEVRTGVARHGIVALLKGGKPGPVVAVRADMDALPILEARETPYKSKNPGVMHACGHDAHTAVQLGVAEVLSRFRAEIPGTVKFIFQPAEEGPPADEEGGAPLMIKEGALENPRPLSIFDLHTSTEIEVGKIGVRPGPAQASSDMFDIIIRGKMAHAAAPQKGVDSIVIAAECITALQTIRSRRVDTFEPFVITIGTIHGGNRRNIISPDVTMEGTVRTLSEDVRVRVKELMDQTLAGVTSAYGASYELKMVEGTRVVFNEPSLAEGTVPVMKRVVGEKNVITVPARMGAEDFSYFQQVVPGFYYRLGTGNPAKGITAEAHTPDFDIDEDSLKVGVKVMANVLVDFLARHAGQSPAGN